MKHWYFSKDEDPNVRPYEPADARSVQPDHYPNILRPGGGYPEGRREDKSDARCNKCKDPLEHGYCNRCDWGLQSTSEPINNYPIDPFEDDKAGIRAASWKFAGIKDDIWQILEEDRKNNKDGISRITNQEISDKLLEQFQINYSAKQVQNRINHFQFRTPQETAYQLKLKAEKSKEKNALSTYIDNNLEIKDYVNSLIEAEDEDGFRLYGNNTILNFIKEKLGRQFDNKILEKYIELEKLNRPPLQANPYGKLQPDDQKALFELAQAAAQQTNAIYGPIDFARQMKELRGLQISPTAINYWINKWKEEGLLPETLETAGGGGYNPEQDGYVYVNHGPGVVKVGITNYLDDRMDAYRRQNLKRGPNESELEYNLSPEFGQEAPGQIVNGPMNGALAAQIEANFKNWFKQMGLNPIEKVGHGYTETVSNFDMPEATWELFKYLINQMSSNQAVDKNYVSSFFNYDPKVLSYYFNNDFGASLGFTQEDFQMQSQQGQRDLTDVDETKEYVEPNQTFIAPGDPGKFSSVKKSDYQGWTNWETWNTKLMIDNEYDLYMQSRRIVEERRPIEQFAEWATQAVIAPHNQRAIADAQEWNEIPYEERPTGREDMPEGAIDLIEGIDEIFGVDPRSDETANILDESKVNWNEIYNSIGEDIKESERNAHQNGEHDLLVSDYMTEYSAPELAEAQAEAHPWCPLCNVERPDDPGDLTIPADWA